MTNREKYDDIYDSVCNGQFKQAVRKFIQLDDTNKSICLSYFDKDLNQPEIAVKISRLYFIFREEV